MKPNNKKERATEIVAYGLASNFSKDKIVSELKNEGVYSAAVLTHWDWEESNE
jgi:hypothetical protein